MMHSQTNIKIGYKFIYVVEVHATSIFWVKEDRHK